MNWNLNHYIRVAFKGDKYLVHSLTHQGRATGINRYYTDDTLPEEIKAKLGMALFGMTGNGVHEVVRDLDDGRTLWVDLFIGMRTYQSIRGDMKRDTRSKGQSASAQDPQ